MVKSTDVVVWLKDIDKEDTIYVGAKAANLGEMIAVKFPVPSGFVITSHAFSLFLHENKLNLKIKHLLGTIHFENPHSIQQVSSYIKKLIINGKIPDQIISSIFSFYSELDRRIFGTPLVALRSSATSEDIKSTSFAGVEESYLNIKGEATLVAKIREAWSSLFDEKAILYRHEHKIDQFRGGIALIVQNMVEADSSGVMFTIDPVVEDKSKIIIEAIYGLGEFLVQGKVAPDYYEIDKKRGEITQKRISEQSIMLKKSDGKNKERRILKFLRFRQKIKDAQIIALAKLGSRIEKHYYFPQDIEWAIAKGKIFIVQTRPITTLRSPSTHSGKALNIFEQPSSEVKYPILVGDPVSPGVGIGSVKIVRTLHDAGKIRKGEIMVAHHTNPFYISAFKKAAAIITESDGRTSHASIVSRELGIPTIVGVFNATKALNNGEVISVNGRTGEIFKGSVLLKPQEERSLLIKTKTALYVSITNPIDAINIGYKNIDGVGLLRAEYMIAQIGIHPRKIIAEKKQKNFIEKLSEQIASVCKAFYPRPVYYRISDFRSDEYRKLEGGKLYEPEEPNPLIGYRGAYRYIKDVRAFALEFEAIKFVREKVKLNNLNVIIPYIRGPKELVQIKKIMSLHGLRQSNIFKLMMTAEIPSNIIRLEEFIKDGIDGVLIDVADLSVFLTGTDPLNHEVMGLIKEDDPSVLWALEKIIKTCKNHKITCSIYRKGQHLSVDTIENVIRWGVKGIVVPREYIEEFRSTIYAIEKRVLKN